MKVTAMKLPAALLVALVLAACTEAQPPPQTAASIKSAPAPSACPLGVAGARVIYEDTETGGRLTFTAPPDQLEDLQSRARDAAALHGPGQRRGQGHDGRHGMGGDHGLRAMQMPPARAEAQDLDGGARIDLSPYDTSDLPALRSKLRQRALELMASCE